MTPFPPPPPTSTFQPPHLLSLASWFASLGTGIFWRVYNTQLAGPHPLRLPHFCLGQSDGADALGRCHVWSPCKAFLWWHRHQSLRAASVSRYPGERRTHLNHLVRPHPPIPPLKSGPRYFPFHLSMKYRSPRLSAVPQSAGHQQSWSSWWWRQRGERAGGCSVRPTSQGRLSKRLPLKIF